MWGFSCHILITENFVLRLKFFKLEACYGLKSFEQNKDFNCSPSRSRRGQEHDRNHDQHSERTTRERQRADHVECRSKEESSGKQKRSKTKARTASPAVARSRSPSEETLNDEAEVRARPRWRGRSPPVTPVSEAREEAPGVERAPAWAEKFFNLQQVSEKRLEELELSLKRANQKPMVEDPQASYTFTKKLYQEQFSFNQFIAQKLTEACGLLDNSNVSVQELLHEGMNIIKSRNKMLVINDRYGYKTGQACAKDPSRRIVTTNKKLKRLERNPYTLRKRKRDSKKGRRHLVVGQLESHFLGMGNSTNQLGDQPADFRSASGAMEWVTLPDHVEPRFCQLTDQTLDLYPNQDLCYSNNCSNLDVISVGSESVNVESQINSSCINEFLSLPESATNHTKQSGLLTAPRVKVKIFNFGKNWSQ